MVSIYLRSPEADDRTIPSYWKGDLIKDKNNTSAVGTLVELTTGYVILIKMADVTATSTVSGNIYQKGWSSRRLLRKNG